LGERGGEGGFSILSHKAENKALNTLTLKPQKDSKALKSQTDILDAFFPFKFAFKIKSGFLTVKIKVYLLTLLYKN
jgi:hypothetical protein